MNSNLPKTYLNTFLYGQGHYEKKITEFLMSAEQVDKDAPAFEDIKYDVKKRQIINALIKILESKSVILLYSTEGLPKAFKVFVAKDPKTPNDKVAKVFIDVSGIITFVEGRYKCTNTDILIAYLVSAMNALIYHKDPKRLMMKSEIIKDGAHCFSLLFTYVVDYLYKISVTSSLKDKCLYLSSLYYQINILQKELDANVRAVSRDISGLSEREEEILLIQLNSEQAFLNIKFFIEEVSNILKLPKLTLELFLEKWLFLYATGTQFGLEIYPAFANMLINVYVGCYLNNQKTIEKVVGPRMVQFVTAILRVGSDAV